MRKIATEGKEAAAAWQQAAQAMERAARAGRTAATNAWRTSSGGVSGSTGAAAIAANAKRDTEEARRLSQPQRMLPYYGPGNVPAPYSRTQDYSTGRVYEGEVIPPSPSGGAGGPPAPLGPTINGTAGRPGAASYGPYGPGGGGGGGGGGGPYGGPPNYRYTPGKEPDLGNGLSSGLGGILGLEFFKSNFTEAAKIDEQVAHLQNQGFSADESAQARRIAFDLQRRLGTPVGLNLHIIEKMMTLTQNKALALDEDALEEYAKFTQITSLHANGKGGGIADLDAAMRAGEFKGYLSDVDPKTGKPDPEKLRNFIKLLSAEYVVSGGDIGPRQTLQYLRSSGGSGAFVSDDELIRSMALQIALGSAKAGSALQGFEQQFTAGRMSEAAANLLIEMGLIAGGGDAKHNKNLRKMGIGQFLLLPGAMPEEMQKTATEDPSLFIQNYLLPKFQAYARKVFGKAFDEGDDKTKIRMEGQVAQSVASRIPGATEQVEVIRNLVLMLRDADAARLALQRDLYGTQVSKNPFIATQKTESAYQALQIGLGEATMAPIVQGLGSVGLSLNQISTWAEHHGEATRVGLEALAAAIAALGAAGVVGILMTLGGTTGVLAAVGAGAVLALQGLQKLEGFLKSTFPAMYKGVDKTSAEIKKDGILPPWWAPGADLGPDWANTLKERLQHPFGPRKSNAPLSQSGNFGASSAPVRVHIDNTQDLVHGIAGGLSNNLNRPPSGVTGHDSSMDAVNAMYGGIP